MIFAEQVGFCGTDQKTPQALKPYAYWYREGESNPHDVTIAGF